MDEADIEARDARTKARAQKFAVELSETEGAFDLMRSQAITDLIASKPAEAAKREQLYNAINVMDTVKAVLLRAVKAGEEVDLIAALQAERNPQG